jgi:hypothetical protein
VIIVEVTLENSFEIHEIPGIPNLSWSDNNIMALQIVYDRLIEHGACLDGLQMFATNLDWQAENIPLTR